MKCLPLQNYPHFRLYDTIFSYQAIVPQPRTRIINTGVHVERRIRSAVLPRGQ